MGYMLVGGMIALAGVLVGYLITLAAQGSDSDGN